MTSIPITSVSLTTGSGKNVTIVNQSGIPLPNSSISWSVVGGTLTFGTSGVAQNLIITTDTIMGGFHFQGNSAGSGSMRATHLGSGHTVDLPVTITDSVTMISAVEVI